MSLTTLLLIVLILFLLGAIPAWPHSREWGWTPGWVIGVILLVVLIQMLLGRI